MFAGANWQPKHITRVNRVLGTSTRPLLAVTDEGLAIVKYLGNRAGSDALITELIAGELARSIGLRTPDFAVAVIPEIETTDPMVTIQAGPAFFSRWEQAQGLSPNSKLLANLRNPADLSRLVVFDTWIRNKDRFAEDENGGNLNYDNLLFSPDKKKTRLLVIDHSHAFAETSLEDEIQQLWAEEQIVYGLFKEFAPMLTRRSVISALDDVSAMALDDIRDICHSPPPDWGLTHGLAERLAGALLDRAARMKTWLPDAIFAQLELDLGKEH